MSAGKLSDDLQAHLAKQQHAEELVEVVVELQHDDAAASMPEMQQAFARRLQPVESAIAEVGGEVTGAAWINSTIRARVPAIQLPRLSDIEVITAVDMPRRITPD